MSKRHVVDVQQIPGIDLDYRPRSYFWALDTNVLLPSGISGEARRKLHPNPDKSRHFRQDLAASSSRVRGPQGRTERLMLERGAPQGTRRVPDRRLGRLRSSGNLTPIWRTPRHFCGHRLGQGSDAYANAATVEVLRDFRQRKRQ